MNNEYENNNEEQFDDYEEIHDEEQQEFGEEGPTEELFPEDEVEDVDFEEVQDETLNVHTPDDALTENMMVMNSKGEIVAGKTPPEIAEKVKDNLGKMDKQLKEMGIEREEGATFKMKNGEVEGITFKNKDGTSLTWTPDGKVQEASIEDIGIHSKLSGKSRETFKDLSKEVGNPIGALKPNSVRGLLHNIRTAHEAVAIAQMPQRAIKGQLEQASKDIGRR